MVKIKEVAAVLAASSFGSTPVLAGDILAEWESAKAPPPPQVQQASPDPKTTALLVMDFMKASCNQQRRPRCVDSVRPVKELLDRARQKGVFVVYTVTGTAPVTTEVIPELAATGQEPVIAARADKFLNSDLDKVLKEKGIKTVIAVGTLANGAVLYTASDAGLRGHDVLVPVDGMSGESAYAEQFTAWQLVNGPGLADRVKLTRTGMISF